jgi:hypothetical protein
MPYPLTPQTTSLKDKCPSRTTIPIIGTTLDALCAPLYILSPQLVSQEDRIKVRQKLHNCNHHRPTLGFIAPALYPTIYLMGKCHG